MNQYNTLMEDLTKRLQDLRANIDDAIRRLDIAADEATIINLTTQTQQPDFWNDPDSAAHISQQLAALNKHVESWRSLQADVTGALELLELADNDEAESLRADLESTYETARADYAAREFELKLSGPHDRSSAIIELHAGTGGTDAQDWTEMLERMYLRYAEKGGYSTEILSSSQGEEAGLKSATIEVNGPYAYGKLKGEAGVHRLVRLSPFNSDNLRQTSFALVEILPQIDNQTTIQIDPKDLRIDVYRAGGHGGQSVNTTDSAVRITHIPTGTVVAIQNERSQLQNKEKAMAILTSRLLALMEAEQKAELGELRAGERAAEWGQQIRNYVLHPYTKVKDTRTGHETGDAAAVLNGEIGPFIDAYLSSQISSSNNG